MLNKTFTLESETGLHARPATELAKIAMKYPCDVKLIANGKTVNAKSPKLFAEMISQTSKSLFKTQCFDYHYNDMYLFLLCEELSLIHI